MRLETMPFGSNIFFYLQHYFKYLICQKANDS